MITSVSQICRAALAALAAMWLAGCSASGPTSRDLVAAGSIENAPFVLVDVTEQSITAVSGWHRPTLSSLYGDYRSPKMQRVGIGDSIKINVWEASHGGMFSTPAADRSAGGSQGSAIPEQVVSRDGTVNVPYAGRVVVAGKSPQEIEQLIVKRLEGKASDPQVLVTLSNNLSYSATITGDVTNGARVPLNPRGDRVLDVIASAGGIKTPVHEAFVTLTRDGTSLTVPLQVILANSRENIYIRPADVVTVFRAPQSFTAVGATGRNAVIGFDASGITLEEALGKAGGLLDERSDPRGVFVLRYEPVTLVQQFAQVPPALVNSGVVPVAYRLDLRDPMSLFKARRFSMRDKDILYVSNAPITEFEKVFRVVGLLTAPAIQGATLYKITK